MIPWGAKEEGEAWKGRYSKAPEEIYTLLEECAQAQGKQYLVYLNTHRQPNISSLFSVHNLQLCLPDLAAFFNCPSTVLSSIKSAPLPSK